MPTRLSRREFLKLSALFGGAVPLARGKKPLGEAGIKLETQKVVRVGIKVDDIYEEPSLDAPIIAHRYRDEIVSVLDEFESDGPPWNPRWYTVVGGYMHTAHLAPIETRYQVAKTSVQPEGDLFRVSIPYTRTFRYSERDGWTPLYRLYYDSNHWVKDVTAGPDGTAWYVIEDDLLHIEYMAPGTHFEYIPPEEYAPITPENFNKKIEISLGKQTLVCYEDGQVIFETNVSTGIPSLGPTTNGIPTETPRGEFNVSMKTPVRHMGDGSITDDIHAYELPGVPWSTFFTETGVAFHGTYWHDNYGGRMSHGCVNMRTHEALWLYRWTTPVYPGEPGKWHVNGYGTRIEIF